MAHTTMQQNHGRTGPVNRVPDSSAIVVHVTLIACDRQRRGTLFFENPEFVVVGQLPEASHAFSQVWACSGRR
jgi:hypothetical protein